jgi:hypothetical protein
MTVGIQSLLSDDSELSYTRVIVFLPKEMCAAPLWAADQRMKHTAGRIRDPCSPTKGTVGACAWPPACLDFPRATVGEVIGNDRREPPLTKRVLGCGVNYKHI